MSFTDVIWVITQPFLHVKRVFKKCVQVADNTVFHLNTKRGRDENNKTSKKTRIRDSSTQYHSTYALNSLKNIVRHKDML